MKNFLLDRVDFFKYGGQILLIGYLLTSIFFDIPETLDSIWIIMIAIIIIRFNVLRPKPIVIARHSKILLAVSLLISLGIYLYAVLGF